MLVWFLPFIVHSISGYIHLFNTTSLHFWTVFHTLMWKSQVVWENQNHDLHVAWPCISFITSYTSITGIPVTHERLKNTADIQKKGMKYKSHNTCCKQNYYGYQGIYRCMQWKIKCLWKNTLGQRDLLDTFWKFEANLLSIAVKVLFANLRYLAL